MSRFSSRIHFAIAAWLLLAGSAAAQDQVRFELTVDGQTRRGSYSSVEQALTSASSIRPSLPAGVPNPAFNYRVDFGTGTIVLSSSTNSPALRLQYGSIDRTFTGATREQSFALLFQCFESGTCSTPLGPQAARSSPVDPVAGNPNSLQSRMVAADFARAVVAAVEGERSGPGLDVRYSSFTSAGFRGQAVTLPFGYTWRLGERDTLQVEVPISWTDTEGVRSYSGNVGLLYRRRITEQWTLQPTLRLGAVGASDRGSGTTGMWSIGLTSTLVLPLPARLRLMVANSVTYLSTARDPFGGSGVSYDLQNTVFRNGLVLSRDLGFQVAQRPLQGSIFAIDTRFTGDALYTRSYQEFGAFFSAGSLSPIRFGFTYLTGDRGLRGFSFNTGVSF